ncbi:MAG: hypothetical protein KKE02_14370 [Alphaproteobacteria bacterium]|nr:hypothetical protein [Alphaproteobacteria bacterium]MBU2095285.1 hypothetical protein [Alphaproteobacteria bacterium]MBU2152200.1 hypothetical protein [Alphaproteobacteria bacterium]MBU2306753.1 hypothetical protein [Alphaproteobacteria bacterium]MBU2361300.1 hypothetical protein [Alphaproteobacteria bacterium]
MLSLAPTSRGDLEKKVGPSVELTATRQGEPGRYDRLGGARFGALNSLTPAAAVWVVVSRQCDKLVDLDTRQSSRDEFVWRGRCENGTVFTLFENDVQAVRPKLKGGLNEASIAAIPQPEPDDGIEPDELDWLKACVDTFRGGLKPGESFLHDTWKLGRRTAGQRVLTVSGKISTDAFHEGAARLECRGDVKSRKVIEITYRAHGVSHVIKG